MTNPLKNCRGLNLAGGRWSPTLISEWNPNIVRMGIRLGSDADVDDLLWCMDKWTTDTKFIPVVWIEKFGLDDPIFYDSAHYHALVQLWQKMATRFKGDSRVIAFDLFNEPSHRKKQGRWTTWNQVAGWLIDNIRRIDPRRTCIVEPLHGSISELSKLKLQGPNVVYSPHMYAPTSYTHQGILLSGEDKPVKFKTIKGRVLTALKAIRAWQDRHKNLAGKRPKVFIGEFSVVRWADGGSDYLKLCIEHFEAYKWSWCYHTLWPEFASKLPPFPEQPWDLGVPETYQAEDGGMYTGFKRRDVVKQGLAKNG